MSEGAYDESTILFRLSTLNAAAFQLRSGEEGLSVFAQNGVSPPLQEDELLGSFRPGSLIISRLLGSVLAVGLQVVVVEGADTLPERLRQAHREIRPAPGMTRSEFKQALKRLE